MTTTLRKIHPGETYVSKSGKFTCRVESVRGDQVEYYCPETRQHGQCSVDNFRELVKGLEAAFRR